MKSTTLIGIAQEYVSHGFSVFPVHSVDENGKCTCGRDCHSPGKHPRTANGVKDATRDGEKIEEWFATDDVNIGIATGQPSGVWVLDDDDVSSNTAVTNQLPKTWTVETGSGNRHYFFRFSETASDLKNCQGIGSWKMDVRTTGGYVVGPPSRHASGGEYKWIVSPDECEIADAPDWLVQVCPKRTPEPGEAKLETPPVGVIRVQSELAGRATAYVAKCPIAVSGQNGHGTTYKVVANVVERFGDLDDEELLGVLSDWNSRCVPPWGDRELRHKLTDARRKTGMDRRVTVDTQSSPDESTDVSTVHLPVLSTDAYHGLLGEIVQAIAPETEADPAGVLVSLLTAFGSAVGNGPRFPVGASAHHGNVFSAIVGDTASGKGQAWSITDRLMKTADPEWRETCIARGLSSGEGFVERVKDAVSDDPLAIVPPKRLLCLETEFARPITAMRREGNTLSPILRSAWDCDTLEVMTRGQTKLRASNAYVSVLAHITPDELKKLLGGSIETVNGFANRFLWTLVRSSRLLPHGGNVSVLDQFGDRLRLAIEKAKTIRGMCRSPEADSLWEKIYGELKRPREGAYGRAVDRAAPQVVRLSMLFALADGSPTIEVDHLQASLAVWRYCDYSARILFGESSSDPLAEKIVDIFRSTGPKTKTEIRNHVSSSKAVRDLIPTTLDDLVRQGRITFDGQTYALSTVHCPPSTDGQSGQVDKMDSGPVQWTKWTVDTVDRMDNGQVDKLDNGQTDTSTLADLLDWKNENGIKFIRDHEGKIWASPHQQNLLTLPLMAAIYDHQDTLAQLVTVTDDTFVDIDEFFADVAKDHGFNLETVPSFDDAIDRYRTQQRLEAGSSKA